MLCEVCGERCHSHGKNRNGTRRFFCPKCFLTYSEQINNAPRAFTDKQLTMEKATTAIKLLMEGTSLRGAARLLRVGVQTLLDLLERVGEGCERLQREIIRN